VPVPVYLSGFDESTMEVEIVRHNDGSYGACTCQSLWI
jgi:hypothetical protein